jgi:hypothetical protein
VVGADGQLAVATVDEDGQPHDAGPAEVGEGVERSADGAAGVEHVVDQHDDLVVDAARRDVGVHRAAGGLAAQVVAVHGHVERTDRHGVALDLLDQRGEPVRQCDATGWDAKQDKVLRSLVVLDDLVGDPLEDAGDIRGAHHGVGGVVGRRGRGSLGLDRGYC